MALSRRTGQRFQNAIWPGFVDAMTGLLLVLMFVLTIFMVVQFVLRETISGQESQLDTLSSEIAALAEALGLEQSRARNLETRVGELTATIGTAQARAKQQADLIATLTAERDAQGKALETARTQIASFEEQVLGLLAAQGADRAKIADLQEKQAELLIAQEALNLALAKARTEIDAGAEAARLAAAKREALEALVAGLKTEQTGLEAKLEAEEAGRLAEAAAAQALREKLKSADAELTAMTLQLEEQRKAAEEVLTLLAAAESAKADLDLRLGAALLSSDKTQAALDAALAENTSLAGRIAGLEGKTTEAATALAKEREALLALKGKAEKERAALEARLAAALADQTLAETANIERDDLREQLRAALAAKLAAEKQSELALTDAQTRAALLSAAQSELNTQTKATSEAQKQQALLNQQVAALRTQLGSLQALLDDYKERDEAAQVQLQTLGSDLNAALARAVSEERKRRQLEEAEAKRLADEKSRLEAEKKDLEKYRSEFFGRLRDVLGNRQGVKIVGDRFVFSSEVLFAPGQAGLSPQGQGQIADVAKLLKQVSAEIPDTIDWVIQVDGHTDNVPLSGAGVYADNWELSQARALSVVRFLAGELEFPPDRLSANGFGEYQPVASENSAAARAQNRRIELKLTER